MTTSQPEREATMDVVADANRGSADSENASMPRVDAVETRAGAASPAVPSQSSNVRSTAAELREAVERMHERDRKRVAAGEISAQDLHFIRAEMARTSVVAWTEAAVRRFRR